MEMLVYEQVITSIVETNCDDKQLFKKCSRLLKFINSRPTKAIFLKTARMKLLLLAILWKCHLKTRVCKKPK